MIAYKFLGPGHVGVISGFDWPVGAWVETAGPLEPGRRGVHACRTEDLPFWVADELWTIELDGEVSESDRFVVARRGRLVKQVAGWRATLREFIEVCVARTRDIPGYGDDAAFWAAQDGGAGPVGYIAAHAAATQTGDFLTAFLAERARQAAWLSDRLGAPAL